MTPEEQERRLTEAINNGTGQDVIIVDANGKESAAELFSLYDFLVSEDSAN